MEKEHLKDIVTRATDREVPSPFGVLIWANPTHKTGLNPFGWVAGSCGGRWTESNLYALLSGRIPYRAKCVYDGVRYEYRVPCEKYVKTHIPMGQWMTQEEALEDERKLAIMRAPLKATYNEYKSSWIVDPTQCEVTL